MVAKRVFAGMMRQERDVANLGKLRASPQFLAQNGATDFNALIQVSKPGYVPDGVEKRRSITSSLMSARVYGGQLASLLRDPNVQLVEPVRELAPYAAEIDADVAL